MRFFKLTCQLDHMLSAGALAYVLRLSVFPITNVRMRQCGCDKSVEHSGLTPTTLMQLSLTSKTVSDVRLVMLHATTAIPASPIICPLKSSVFSFRKSATDIDWSDLHKSRALFLPMLTRALIRSSDEQWSKHEYGRSVSDVLVDTTLLSRAPLFPV